VAGHRGKKHKLTSGRMVGKTQNVANIVIEAFEIIEKKSQKNPLEVLITAVENAAPLKKRYHTREEAFSCEKES